MPFMSRAVDANMINPGFVNAKAEKHRPSQKDQRQDVNKMGRDGKGEMLRETWVKYIL